LSSTLGVTGATTLGGTLGVTGATNLSSTLGVTGATNLSSTLGVTGATNLSSTLGVTGATNLSSTLSVSGITTIIGLLDANGGATIDNIQIGITGNNEIDTSSGNLTIDSFEGTTTIDDNLIVKEDLYVGKNGGGNSIIYFYNDSANNYANRIEFNDVAATLDTNSVAADTFYFSSRMFVNGALEVSGIATFQSDVFLGDGDDLYFGAGNDLRIYHNGNHSYIDVTSGGTGDLYIRNERIGGSIFIQADNASGDPKTVFQATGANSAAQLFYDGTKRFETTSTGVVVSGIITATIGFVPDVNGAYLGTALLPFSEAHIGEIRIANSTGDNEIDTATGNLILDSADGTVEIQDNLTVSGITTLTGLLDANGGATIDNIRIGVANDNEIDTAPGTGNNLILDSAGGTVEIQDNLTVSGIATFNGNVDFGNATSDTVTFTSRVDSNVLPSTNAIDEDDIVNGKDLGATNRYWRKIYAREFIGALTGNASTATLASNLNRSVIAGNGLTGGGSLNNQNITLNVVGGSGITVSADAIAVDSTVVRTTGNQTIGGTKTFSSTISGSINGNAATATLASNLNRSVIAGNGLTGGGVLNNQNITLNVVGGSGITVSADAIAVDSTVVRTTGNQSITASTSGNAATATLAANLNRSVIAGNGLTGGGVLNNQNVTLNVVGGIGGGITVSADAIAVDSTVVRTTGNQTILGTKTFSSIISGSINGNASTATLASNLNRSVIAGNGLTGGGVLNNQNITLNVVGGIGGGITVSADAIAVDSTVVRTTGNQTILGTKTFDSTISGSINGNAATATLASNLNRSVIAGNGLTGGGVLNNQNITLNVVGGSGITVSADAIAVDSTVVRTTGNQTILGTKTFDSTISGSINGNAATATLAANLNRSVIAGNGLTGGGVLNNQNVTLNIGEGDGISVNTNSVAVDSTVVRTTGNQTILGIKTFDSTISGSINGNAATASQLQILRNFSISGDVTTNTAVSFNGTGAVNLVTTLSNDAVTNLKIADNAVSSRTIADNAVTAAKIKNKEVGTDELADSAVTAAKMGSGSVSILHTSNVGSSSINLTLDSGTWFVEFYYTTHVFELNSAMSMRIDGTVVQTTPVLEDYQGTYYVPMFGADYVTGSRTITCSISGAITEPDANVQRCMVKATRVY
jgi:fibronectin-binding autotransporter adhesin